MARLDPEDIGLHSIRPKPGSMKDTPQLRGALDRVSHLVEEVKD